MVSMPRCSAWGLSLPMDFPGGLVVTSPGLCDASTVVGKVPRLSVGSEWRIPHAMLWRGGILPKSATASLETVAGSVAVVG